MQSRLLPLKLWLFICDSLLSAAKKKNNPDWETTLKIQPSGQTPAGLTCQSNLWQRSSLLPDFCFQMTSVIKRSAIYLQVGLKITNKASDSGCSCVIY